MAVLLYFRYSLLCGTVLIFGKIVYTIFMKIHGLMKKRENLQSTFFHEYLQISTFTEIYKIHEKRENLREA